MFDWLVKKMNTTIQPDELYDPSFGQKAKTIGLLDIFGFENFADPSANKSGNNFEQLCINYVNEKLHKLYISAIFEAEKKELKEEGLGERTDDIKFESDVNEIISLIDYHSSALAYKGIKYTPAHPAGIFPAVDDMTKGKAPNAKEIGENFKKSYAKYCPTLFEMNMKRKDQFRIKHSAEAVWYDHTEFVIRDVDSIPDALEACMSEYSCKEVRYIYQVLLDEA
jgi:myosin heavy subunit